MIKSFSCRDTAALFERHRVPRFANIERVALRKLVQLNVARTVSDLRVPPSNRLERLSGDLEGRFSIRINDQWRVCFAFRHGDATDVAIIDYHGINRCLMATPKLLPVHPGELLLEEFLKPMGLSQYALAKAIEVPPRRINEIVHGKRAITADTDLRMCRYFGLTEGYWLRGQAYYDLEIARSAITDILARIQPYAPHPIRTSA